ncbi:hypothetical protein [Streptomyces sp. TRM64462]|uniref:hypothetical protein n=1 Tax=Streptomyces sp. TRM64462 TaxID=2741726 RepID=UPI0015865CE4|nr:hypothetical protein [Streptomyces sp. TRM64462]
MSWASWTTTGVITEGGGVRTDEAGLVRGDLSVHTTWTDGRAIVTVQYSGASEWYTITGSPVACATEEESRQLHQEIVEAVRTGDPAAVLLSGRRVPM